MNIQLFNKAFLRAKEMLESENDISIFTQVELDKPGERWFYSEPSTDGSKKMCFRINEEFRIYLTIVCDIGSKFMTIEQLDKFTIVMKDVDENVMVSYNDYEDHSSESMPVPSLWKTPDGEGSTLKKLKEQGFRKILEQFSSVYKVTSSMYS